MFTPADDGLPAENSRDEAWFRTSRSRSAVSRTLSCDSTGASAKPSKTRSASPTAARRPGQGTHHTQICTRRAPASRPSHPFIIKAVTCVLRLPVTATGALTAASFLHRPVRLGWQWGRK
jgi:hypothetical protein